MELNHQTSPDSFFMEVPNFASVSRAGNLSHAMGERNQVGIGLSDRPARLHCKSGSFVKYLNQLYSTDQIAMVWFCENHH